MDNTIKLCGGMFHAESWEDATERAAAGYSVHVRPGGGADWIDKDGKRASLYLSVLPERTKRGRTLIEAEHKRQAIEREKEQTRRAALNEQLEQLIHSIGIEQAIARLGNKPE
jgi:hypothetical protein